MLVPPRSRGAATQSRMASLSAMLRPDAVAVAIATAQTPKLVTSVVAIVAPAQGKACKHAPAVRIDGGHCVRQSYLREEEIKKGRACALYWCGALAAYWCGVLAAMWIGAEGSLLWPCKESLSCLLAADSS